ncbi:hypothetical protein QYE76_001877 [Lolium multiflorum]|uniref:Uncharacterized protein n=1 Tax=Lolium multiflorum TaxID=4521 RepID=A0AAD8RMX5_LOLMU|nr:hypothetical protein QYE76_001877 [Lolium multiflorum]
MEAVGITTTHMAAQRAAAACTHREAMAFARHTIRHAIHDKMSRAAEGMRGSNEGQGSFGSDVGSTEADEGQASYVDSREGPL